MITKNKIAYAENAEIELIEPDYNGIADALDKLIKLYEVSDNKQLIDKVVKSLFLQPPSFIIKTQQP